MRPWSKPRALPKFRAEYACYALTEVPPLEPRILNSYAKYLAKKEELTQKLSEQTAKVTEMKSKYTIKSFLAKADNSDQNTLLQISAKLDALAKDNRLLEDIVSLHTKMEESYHVTKQLQEDSRASWSEMYS